jgi:colanic acid biosynthesis glycosyl transferase WcaI
LGHHGKGRQDFPDGQPGLLFEVDMRVFVITEYYKPDGGPAAPLFTMLCEGLVRRGHVVTVITPVPHYPSGQVPADFRKIWIRRTNENGVNVIRVGLPSVNRARLPARLLQFITYQLEAVLAGWSEAYDVVLAHSSALEVWLPFIFFSKVRHKPAVYSVHDVYPDVGIKLGIFRNPFVIRLVTALEKSCLQNAGQVRILSKSFKASLVKLGVPEAKIHLIYDWVETELIKPRPRRNAFAAENGLLDHFVVLYAGNIGLSQGLENVLLAAERLTSYPDLLFVFVGDGTGRAALVAETQRRRLDNVRFLPFQPRLRLPEVLASADVGLIILKKGIGIQSLPSKIFSILASGRPLIASVDEGSDTWDLVGRSGAGLPIPPEDPDQLKEAILRLQKDAKLRETMGKNGREYVTRFHSPDYAAKAFEKLLCQAMESEKKQH